jgi:hypothetical protein
VVGIGLACVDQCGVDATAPVTLTAVANEGWSFASFSPPCGAGATCVAAPGSTIVATFTPTPITANTVFISSTSPPITGGVAALDAFCQTRATAAGLAQTFVAFVSSSTVNAKDRLAGSRGWVRVDGLPFLDQPTDLGSATLPRGVVLDEAGGTYPNFVMTGSDRMGVATSQTCMDWTSTAGAVDGVSASYASYYATGFASSTCAGSPRVLCVGTGRTVAVELAPAPFPVGRYVFVTTQPFTIGGGVAAADAQCAAEAASNGLPGAYRAILASTTQSASDHVGGFAGVWRRPDGIVVARAGLDHSPLDAAPHLDPTRAVLPNQAGFFGATSATGLGTMAATCADWTSTTTGPPIVVQSNSMFMLGLTAISSAMCGGSAFHLMCAQLP